MTKPKNPGKHANEGNKNNPKGNPGKRESPKRPQHRTETCPLCEAEFDSNKGHICKKRPEKPAGEE